MTFTMQWNGSGMAEINHALKGLGGRKMEKAIRRATNHVGDRVFTKVKAALAKQVGVTQATVVRKGALRRYRASYSNLGYLISAKGKHLSLKEFNPKQLSKGTKASPWGRRELFDHAFMGPRPGEVAGKLGGHVFARDGAGRLPIQKLWGPAIPLEMVKGFTAATFHAVVSERLPKRVEHEIRRLTKGAAS